MNRRHGGSAFRLLLSGALIGAAAAGVLGLGHAQRARAHHELVQAARARETRLRALIDRQTADLEHQARLIAGMPAVLAVLAPEVDVQALRDLFDDPDQDRPLRGAFDRVAVAEPGGAPQLVMGRSAAFTDDDLVERARTGHKTVGGFALINGALETVVAVPVALGEAGVPVLLMARPFDAEALGPLVDGTGEAIALSDGRRLLVGAGPITDIAALKQTLGQPLDAGPVEIVPQREALAAVALTPAVWLVSHVDVAQTVRRATAGYAISRLAAGVLGASLVLLVLFHRRREDEAAHEEARPATVTETSSGSRYILLRRIGGGGMADVHLALSVGERGFRRPCVVKRLRPELARDPEAVAQFTDEASVASSLVHANIVPIFDFAQAGRDYLMVEEYVSGRDLDRLVRRASESGKPLAPELVAHVGLEICKALSYAHNRRDPAGHPLGIVHRDVSPENIMITSRGEVQLLDFGVLKTDRTEPSLKTNGDSDDDATGERRQPRTETGKLQGSLRFMAPEQARGLDVDSRADLFSLGLTLYFALTGEPLYGSLRGYDLLVRAATGPGSLERARLATLPAPFARILVRLLSARDQRHPTAAALAEDLAGVVVSPEAGVRLGERVRELFDDDLAEEQSSLSASATAARAIKAEALPPSPIAFAAVGARQAR